MPDSLRVVKAFTGDDALTRRANLTTRWLRRDPVRRGVVRFLGLPILSIKLLIDSKQHRLNIPHTVVGRNNGTLTFLFTSGIVFL